MATTRQGAPRIPVKTPTGCYVGPFTNEWNNPPAPFNPQFDPKAAARSSAAAESMSADGYYDTHTREECAAEWRRRYDDLKSKGQ